MSRYDYSIISIEQRKLNKEELNNEPPLIAKKKVK